MLWALLIMLLSGLIGGFLIGKTYDRMNVDDELFKAAKNEEKYQNKYYIVGPLKN